MTFWTGDFTYVQSFYLYIHPPFLCSCLHIHLTILYVELTCVVVIERTSHQHHMGCMIPIQKSRFFLVSRRTTHHSVDHTLKDPYTQWIHGEYIVGTDNTWSQCTQQLKIGHILNIYFHCDQNVSTDYKSPTFWMYPMLGPSCTLSGACRFHSEYAPRSIPEVFGDHILNVVVFLNVFNMCPKCTWSVHLDTLRSHDWVHSKGTQCLPHNYIKFTFMGIF